MDKKTCTGPCRRDLPLKELHRNGPRRRHSQCKQCRAVGHKLQALALPAPPLPKPEERVRLDVAPRRRERHGRDGSHPRSPGGPETSGRGRDRWPGYDYLDPSRRQFCWAHLLRDFTAHSEGMGEQKRFGNDCLQIAHDLVNAWAAYQHDHDQARLQAQTAPLQTKLHATLEHATRKSPRTKYHRAFANNLLNRWPALWTFTHTDGVEPTNNHGERGLRGAVIYRKLSLGSQSEQGERTIERLLSDSLTCRLQRRSLFAYLTDVLTANIR